MRIIAEYHLGHWSARFGDGSPGSFGGPVTQQCRPPLGLFPDHANRQWAWKFVSTGVINAELGFAVPSCRLQNGSGTREESSLMISTPLLAEQGLLAVFVGYAFAIVLFLVIITRTPKLLAWLFNLPTKRKTQQRGGRPRRRR